MLQGRVDDIYRVLASRTQKMSGLLRTAVLKDCKIPKKGSSSKKMWLSDLQNTNIAIEDEAENKSSKPSHWIEEGQDPSIRKLSLDDSYQKDLIPLLNLQERKTTSEMTDDHNISKRTNSKPRKKANSRLESSFYRSESKGDQSIYEKILANIRFTKRSQGETPRSKRPSKYKMFKTPLKEESRHSETSKIAASGLRSKHTFTQSKEGLLIYDSEVGLAPDTGDAPEPVSNKLYFSQSQLTSRQRRTYIYSRSIERSYTGLFVRRKSLARSCSRL
jgi:hypothetical protein